MKTFTLNKPFLLIGMLLTSLNIFSQTVVPIAYWSFDENSGTEVTDSKSGFIGTLEGAAEFSTSEIVSGSSLSLNGSTDFVKTNLQTEIQEAENITLMAWFNTNVVEVTQQHIFWIGDIAGNGWGAQQEINVTINHFNAELQNSNLCLFYGSSADTGPNNVNFVSSDATFGPGEWHHIAAVIKNMSGTDGPTEAEIYLDGAMVTPYDWTATTYGFANSNIAADLIDRTGWNSPLLIGIGGVGTRAFNGYIDEVKVFDISLTEDEIKTAMKASGTNGSPIITKANDPLIYPNTIKDQLIINNASTIHSIEIVNASGKKVLSTTDKNNINISHLQKGIYFVKLNTENSSKIQKIVKE